MKLKSLLKVTVATKIEIIEKREINKNITHLVDYLSDSNEVINCFDDYFKYPCKELLPEYLLEKNVKAIDINEVNKSIYIIIK